MHMVTHAVHQWGLAFAAEVNLPAMTNTPKHLDAPSRATLVTCTSTRSEQG